MISLEERFAVLISFRVHLTIWSAIMVDVLGMYTLLITNGLASILAVIHMFTSVVS